MHAAMFCVMGGLMVLALSGGRAEAALAIPVIDAYIEDFSSSGELDGIPDRIRNTNALLSGRGTLSSGAAIDSRSIVIFDVSSYAGQTLSSAVLSGFGGGVDHNFAPETIDGAFWLSGGDGAVTLEDFNRPSSFLGAQTFPGMPLQFPFPLSLFELPVTAAVQSLLDQAGAFAEFRIESDELTLFVNAEEAEAPFQPDTRFPGPRLTLNVAQASPGPVVPEPSSFYLLGSGLLGLAAAQRRRTRRST